MARAAAHGVSALLAAAGTVALLTALGLVAWLATLPSRVPRLAAIGAVALMAWLLMPLAIETGLRDLARWLGEGDRVGNLAALGTLDGMVVAALAGRGLLGAGGRREQWLLRVLPPLATPLAVFGLCVLVAYLVNAVAFDALPGIIALACVPALLALTVLLRSVLPEAAARLELRLAAALLQVVAAAVLAGFATAAPGGAAQAVDGVALAAVLVAAVLVGAAGFAWERRGSRR
jgi:hypothetical protein